MCHWFQSFLWYLNKYKTVKIVKLTSGSFNSFIMIDGGRVVRVDAYIGTFLIKTARGALLCVLTPGLRRQFALCICTHCGCIWDANVLYLCIAGTVFVLYLYCICIAGRGWVEKLQSALTPLGTPKDARWQLSPMKGSTLLLLLYRDWILAKSFKPMTSFQTTFYSFRGFHFNRIKTFQPAISNIWRAAETHVWVTWVTNFGNQSSP